MQLIIKFHKIIFSLVGLLPQIRDMMKDSGLENIAFSPAAPYWCVVGYKRANTDK